MQITCWHAVKFIKDQFLIFFSDPNSIVTDLDQQTFLFITCMQRDVRFLVTVFYRIIQKVVDHICDMYWVSLNSVIGSLQIKLN